MLPREVFKIKTQRKGEYMYIGKNQPKSCHLKERYPNLYNTLYISKTFFSKFQIMCNPKEKGSMDTHTYDLY